MNNMEPEAAGRGGRDWQLWAILGVLALAFAAIIWLANRGEQPLAPRSAKTGLPLTREQQSVEFQTADLTFEVLPSKQRIEGHAVLGFVVKAPIAKLQFDLDPELPISAI